MQCWISHCLFFFSKATLLTPTCCNKPRILLLWEHAETWCDQTPAWCRRSPCSGSPSPGLRRTWQRQRAWPTERWPQQTPGPPECPQPSVKERKEQSKEQLPPRRSLSRQQLKVHTHHNHILAQKSPNISWGVLNRKASPVLHVSLWFRGVVPVMSDWKSTGKVRLMKAAFCLKC